MKLVFLTNKISWFGKYSGYECLTNYLLPETKYIAIQSNSSFVSKLIGKYHQIVRRWQRISPQEIYAGLVFIRRASKNTVSHILYLENHVHLLSIHKKSQTKLIGTVHLPLSQWKQNNLQLLSKLSYAILLYKEEIDLFSRYISKDKIIEIKHGVDIKFFKPGISSNINTNKILFVGHYLRNFSMFFEVLTKIHKNISNEIEFHIIVPSLFRTTIPRINDLIENDRVHFHERLSDEELLAHYQTSYVLLMPMQDSGANTAIVQAIATGLPVITTDVGGIRSYGGGDVFPVVPNNNCEAMVQLFCKYYGDKNYRNEISENLRRYAVENLDWNIVAKQHEDLYVRLSSESSFSN